METALPADLPHVFPEETHPAFLAARELHSFVARLTLANLSHPPALREAKHAAWRLIASVAALDRSMTERERSRTIARARQAVRKIACAVLVLADSHMLELDAAAFGRRIVARVARLLACYPGVPDGETALSDERPRSAKRPGSGISVKGPDRSPAERDAVSSKPGSSVHSAPSGRHRRPVPIDAAPGAGTRAGRSSPLTPELSSPSPAP